MSTSRTFACVVSFLMWFPGPAGAQQDIALVTRDGVQVKASYYPPPRAKTPADAKQTTPVVLLHDFKDTRASFASLVERLQSPGEGDAQQSAFAVVAVDLRGHGASTKQTLPNGEIVELDAAKLGKNDLIAMAAFD